jgi:hemolysin D
MAARDALNLAESQYAAFLAKDAGLLAAIKEKQAEMITVEQTVTSLAEYEKIASARVADYQRLLEKKYVSRQEYLIRVQEKIAAGKDLLAQRNRFTELARAVDIAVRDRAANRAETLRSWLDDERSANEQSEQLLKEVGKATDRETSMNLVSPSDGQVQQLAVHSVGGVVTPGQALMSIVPAQESAVAEIQILNQDIGFITPGQAAIAKVSSFPYTRYGYLPAHIVSVSQDSIKDEKQGWVFPAVVALERNSLNVDGKAVKLSPGMDLTVEIRTSHRTVLEYLLDPIKSQVHEGLHER